MQLDACVMYTLNKTNRNKTNENQSTWPVLQKQIFLANFVYAFLLGPKTKNPFSPNPPSKQKKTATATNTSHQRPNPGPSSKGPRPGNA